MNRSCCYIYELGEHRAQSCYHRRRRLLPLPLAPPDDLMLETEGVEAYVDLRHYHAYSPASPQPTADQLRKAVQQHTSALAGRHVLFAIMASCALPGRLNIIDEALCRRAGGRCLAYVDCESDAAPATSATMQVVPASEYVDAAHAPNPRCCSVGLDVDSGWDGHGPSSFYCASISAYHAHMNATLPAQYRFLPALQHATTYLRSDDDEKRWLVMVDDDSRVSLPRLLSVLGGYNYEEPIQVSRAPPCRRGPPVAPRLHPGPCERPANATRPQRTEPRADPPPPPPPPPPPLPLPYAARRLCPGPLAQRDALEAAVCMRRRGHRALARGGATHRLGGLHARL